MTEKKLDLFDYIIILVKWKKLMIALAVITLIISYLGIYFIIEEKFDSTSLVIPSDNESYSGMAGLLGGITSQLPFGISGVGASPEMSMYTTIIYSRTNLEKIVDKYNLIDVFKINRSAPDFRELAIITLRDNITTSETETMAYEIKVRMNSPTLSAEINNFIIAQLNETLINLKTKKSRENRIFLENRLDDLYTELEAAEDSLMSFQSKSGIINPEEQFKGIVSAYMTLETQLIAKQIEKSIIEKIRNENSPQFKNIELEVLEFETRLIQMRKKGEAGGLLPSLESLPKDALTYYRLLRTVEINSKILEFILPLYEQSKLEEKKEIPILQIVDVAIPPKVKSFPPRVLLTLLIAISVFLFTFFVILLKENKDLQDNEKLKFIKRNIFKWRSK